MSLCIYFPLIILILEIECSELFILNVNKLCFKVYAMEKGEFGEKEELMQRLSKSEQECIKLSEEVARLGDAERRYQV